jgi:glycosyltransferase involved in cell wall biosynthesis
VMPAPLAPPARIDRLVVHQVDVARASPGGIDTCIRGICRYVPDGVSLAVVGVDTGSGPAGRRLGVWEKHRTANGGAFWFLPVSRFDPAVQQRRVPHSLRLMAGAWRFRRALPTPGVVQVHRMDTAVASLALLRRPQSYFIHTQENGLTGRTSDSFWRFAARAHRWLESFVVRRARSVVVFNEEYSAVVRRWNSRARFSPTWYDPSLIDRDGEHDAHRIVWVGRLERPKDPVLAVDAFQRLVDGSPDEPWSLELLGSGTLLDEVREHVRSLPEHIRRRVSVPGRVEPESVAARMAAAGTFLMTSHPGYEGYPRVLVEAMASGLPAVVTTGSDTGGLVEEGRTGFVCSRDPEELASALSRALELDRTVVAQRVAPLDAPTLVASIVLEDRHPAAVSDR